MNYSAILFDLDGVIVDSGLGISSCANTALSHFGFKNLEPSLIVSFIGNGAKRLIQDTLTAAGVDYNTMASPSFDEFFSWYLAHYEKNAVDKTPMYKDVAPLLEHLTSLGIPLGLVTSKPLAVTKIVLSHYRIDRFFDAVVCPEMVTHLKPHPESLELAVKTIEEKRSIIIDKSNVLMVGDSATDIQAGRALGAKTCAITGGLGNAEKLIAEKADIVLELACELMYNC